MKVELERVAPADIERRSFEIIEAELPHSPELDHFVAFIRGSERGIAR